MLGTMRWIVFGPILLFFGICYALGSRHPADAIFPCLVGVGMTWMGVVQELDARSRGGEDLTDEPADAHRLEP